MLSDEEISKRDCDGNLIYCKNRYGNFFEIFRCRKEVVLYGIMDFDLVGEEITLYYNSDGQLTNCKAKYEHLVIEYFDGVTFNYHGKHNNRFKAKYINNKLVYYVDSIGNWWDSNILKTGFPFVDSIPISYLFENVIPTELLTPTQHLEASSVIGGTVIHGDRPTVREPSYIKDI